MNIKDILPTPVAFTRVCHLINGDIFLMWGQQFVVEKINNGRIVFAPLNKNRRWLYHRQDVGANNQMWVELVHDNWIPKIKKHFFNKGYLNENATSA